jgi:hypothetical protein
MPVKFNGTRVLNVIHERKPNIYVILCFSLAGPNSGERRMQGFMILKLY